MFQLKKKDNFFSQTTDMRQLTSTSCSTGVESSLQRQLMDRVFVNRWRKVSNHFSFWNDLDKGRKVPLLNGLVPNTSSHRSKVFTFFSCRTSTVMVCVCIWFWTGSAHVPLKTSNGPHGDFKTPRVVEWSFSMVLGNQEWKVTSTFRYCLLTGILLKSFFVIGGLLFHNRMTRRESEREREGERFLPQEDNWA